MTSLDVLVIAAFGALVFAVQRTRMWIPAPVPPYR